MSILRTESLQIRMADRQLCRDLDLRLEAGQCLGVLGRNGAGKTTLLHTLLNLRSADTGSIEVCGKPLAGWSRKELAMNAGILFQDYSSEMPATVMEIVMMGRHPHASGWLWESSEDQRIALAALARLGLEDLRERQVSTLSGGERQRLSIATLIAQRPKLYLLDEPSNHLDIGFQARAVSLLQQTALESGAGICMATHDINLAARFCDQILLLFSDTSDGRYRCGATAEVLTEANLELAYDCTIRKVVDDGSTYFFAA